MRTRPSAFSCHFSITADAVSHRVLVGELSLDRLTVLPEGPCPGLGQVADVDIGRPDADHAANPDFCSGPGLRLGEDGAVHAGRGRADHGEAARDAEAQPLEGRQEAFGVPPALGRGVEVERAGRPADLRCCRMPLIMPCPAWP